MRVGYAEWRRGGEVGAGDRAQARHTGRAGRRDGGVGITVVRVTRALVLGSCPHRPVRLNFLSRWSSSAPDRPPTIIANRRAHDGAPQGATAMSITIRTEFDVKPGKVEEVLALFRERRALARTQPGFEFSGLARKGGSPFRLRLLATWQSEAALSAFGALPAYRVLVDRTNPLVNVVQMEGYDLVHSVRGQAFAKGQTPGVALEKEWILKPGGAVAAAFIASRKEQFELIAKESAGFLSHSLLRHRGAFHRFRVINTHPSREDSPLWAGPTLPAGSPVYPFIEAHPESLYTDVLTYFEVWEPVELG